MRLIDAEELEQSAYEMFVHARMPSEQIIARTIRDMIENTPTIDAAQVVRCKDCKYHGTDACGELLLPPDDWFCADGER